MNDSMRSPGAEHDGHDLELVARAAAGDLDADEAIAGRGRLSTCETCAALAADLRAIAAATREIGAAGRVAPQPAPRDFRLTEADAARLRRRGVLGVARSSTWLARRARGFGGALATLGLVGLLLSAGLPGLGGSAASQPTSQEFGASGQKDNASPVPALGPAASDAQELQSSDEPSRLVDQSREQLPPSAPSPVLVASVSGVLLVIGLAFLAIGGRRGRAAP